VTSNRLSRRHTLVADEQRRSRWLRDRAFRDILDCQVGDPWFTEDDRGRPHLRLIRARGRIIDFSVTHAGGTVGVAVVEGARIGLDLEPQRPIAAGRVRRAFNDAEWAAIATSEDADTALLSLWTQKEALVKAIGVGLRWPPAEVLAGAHERGGALWVRPVAELDPQRRWWTVYRLEPVPGLVGACAVSSAPQGVAAPIIHVVDPGAVPGPPGACTPPSS
jgi:phosphopantetheinyl transferase